MLTLTFTLMALSFVYWVVDMYFMPLNAYHSYEYAKQIFDDKQIKRLLITLMTFVNLLVWGLILLMPEKLALLTGIIWTIMWPMLQLKKYVVDILR